MIKLLTNPTETIIDKGHQLAKNRSVWKARAIFLIGMPLSMVELSVKHCLTVFKTTTFFLSRGYFARDYKDTQLDLMFQVIQTSQLCSFGITDPELTYDFVRDTNHRDFGRYVDRFDFSLNGTRLTFDKMEIRNKTRIQKLLGYTFGLHHSKHWVVRELSARATYLGLGFLGTGDAVLKTIMAIFKLVVNIPRKEARTVARLETQYQAGNAARLAYLGFCGVFFNPKT